MSNVEKSLKHVLAFWYRQPDKSNLAINPEFLIEMVDLCDSPNPINPEWLTAPSEIWFGGSPPPKRPAIFIAIK